MSLSSLTSLANVAMDSIVVESPAAILYYWTCNTGNISGGNLISTAGITDTSGNAPLVNGSITTSTFKFGDGSASLAVNTSYIDVSNKLDLRNGVASLTMWFRTTSTNPYVALALFSDGTVDDYIRLSGTNVQESGNSTSNILRPTEYNTTNLKDGNWHHLAWVGFGNAITRSVYIDGNLWSNYTYTTFARNATSTRSRLGNAHWDTASHLLGNIDDVQIYSGRLTQAQVTAIYTNGGVI